MSSAAIRCLKVLKVLRGHTFAGISNSDIAKTLGESAPNITRALDDLVAEGLAEKRPDGRYCLSIAMLQIATSHFTEMQRIQQRVDEINQRVNTH